MKFNPSMDKLSRAQYNAEWNYSSIPNHQWLHRWSLRMDKWYRSTHHNGYDYQAMLRLKLAKNGSEKCISYRVFRVYVMTTQHNHLNWTPLIILPAHF